jgi:hypothetical protein
MTIHIAAQRCRRAAPEAIHSGGNRSGRPGRKPEKKIAKNFRKRFDTL